MYFVCKSVVKVLITLDIIIDFYSIVGYILSSLASLYSLNEIDFKGVYEEFCFELRATRPNLRL